MSFFGRENLSRKLEQKGDIPTRGALLFKIYFLFRNFSFFKHEYQKVVKTFKELRAGVYFSSSSLKPQPIFSFSGFSPS